MARARMRALGLRSGAKVMTAVLSALVLVGCGPSARETVVTTVELPSGVASQTLPAPERTSPRDACPVATDPDGVPLTLQFVDDATLLVGRRHLLDLASGRLDPVPWQLDESQDGSDYRIDRVMAIDGLGQRIAVLEPGGLRVGALRGPVGEIFALPVLAGFQADRKENLTLREAVAFHGGSRVAIDRLAPYGSFHQCDVFDLETKTFRRATRPCIEGDMYEVFDVIHGPEGLTAIYSLGEGHPGVSIVRMDESGQHPVVSAPQFDLYPAGPLRITFDGLGKGAWITTVCPLEQSGKESHPCLERGTGVQIDDGEGWRLYRWQLGDPTLQLVATGLTPNALPSPDGQRMAWARGDCVCLGDPHGPVDKCYPIAVTPSDDLPK